MIRDEFKFMMLKRNDEQGSVERLMGKMRSIK
jgi:hypothetical protein